MGGNFHDKLYTWYYYPFQVSLVRNEIWNHMKLFCMHYIIKTYMYCYKKWYMVDKLRRSKNIYPRQSKMQWSFKAPWQNSQLNKKHSLNIVFEHFRIFFLILFIYESKSPNKLPSFTFNYYQNKNIAFSKCLLRHDAVRVFVSFCVLIFVRAILSWCT